MKVKSSPYISLNPSPPSPQKKKRPYYKIPDDGYTADIDNNTESSDSSDELSDSSQPRKKVKHNSDNTKSTPETPATLTHINQADLRTAAILIRMNSSN